MQRYEKYKDSGIDWLGAVPEHWELNRLKHLFKEKKKVLNFSLSAGSISFGEVVFKDDEKIPESTKATYQEVLKGDYLINPLNLNYDLISLRIALSDIDVVVSSGYIVIQDVIQLNKNYYKWLLHQYDVSYMKLLGSGVRQTISFNNIANSELPYPNLDEQEVIANFLDDKCGKIDAAVALKKQQIEKLKELRQITIHNAVTKGISHFKGEVVPTKDSGIDWIGEVPEDWEVKRLKYIFLILKRIAGREGYEVLSITQKGIKVKDVKSGEGQLAMDYSKYQLAYKGEFAMNHMDLLTGWVDISEYDGVISPDYRVFTLINDRNFSPYFLFVLQDCYSSKIFYAHGQGVSMLGRWRFPTENFNNFFFPIPPLTEQKEIVEYLEEQTSKIDKAITQKQEQIIKLKEYKQSLINEVVTGKLKVVD